MINFAGDKPFIIWRVKFTLPIGGSDEFDVHAPLAWSIEEVTKNTLLRYIPQNFTSETIEELDDVAWEMGLFLWSRDPIAVMGKHAKYPYTIRKDKTQFYNKSGELSRYGLACGYRQMRETETRWTTLDAEHGVFIVASGLIGAHYNHRKVHESLVEARKDYWKNHRTGLNDK